LGPIYRPYNNPILKIIDVVLNAHTKENTRQNELKNKILKSKEGST